MKLNMDIKIAFYYICGCVVQFSSASFVFHENTHIMFTPSSRDHNSQRISSDYFGYSTLLGLQGLFVGAPKAAHNNITSGGVYYCPLENLEEKQVACHQLSNIPTITGFYYPYVNWQPDMWFGASLSFLPNNRLIISAPRTTMQYDNNLLMHGTCYLVTQRRSRILDPLSDGRRASRQAYVTDGIRREYGPSNTHLYYYAQGQVGFSVAVTKLNTIILGTPGLLQWTGGFVTYSFNPNFSTPFTYLLPITNPYHTMELEPDDYFGYSVDSGIFEYNGSVLYVAGAPRSNIGGGKVLVFTPPTDELKPLDIKVKLFGRQIGSYFGASICCTDINNDGLDDLLVGAPTFVNKNVALPYDQGAVFVYITNQSSSGFILQDYGYVSGSEADGAKFGSVIADLGDVNGDGFKDVAIGAPWESDGVGAVYIYMGSTNGLRNDNVQRIQQSGARGFGVSVSKGLDVDGNLCNDLAVGAYDSGASYLYRCIPSLPVHASIRIPNAINLPHNTTTFTAMFCVSAPSIKFRSDVKLKLMARVEADLEDNRAVIVEDSEYTVTVAPENEECDQKSFFVNLDADLEKPILLSFKLAADEMMKDDSIKFLKDAARLSDDSTLETSSLVQLMRDCGDDLTCTPWLTMTLEALDNPYIPGTNQTFGLKVTVVNEEEPAYGLMVYITLPTIPKRIPSDCSFQNLIMTCDFPQPFLRNDEIVWDIELEYSLNIIKDVDFKVSAKLIDKFDRNITDQKVEQLVLKVTPKASFSVSGKSMPNASMTVLRDNLSAGTGLLFTHYFEITNIGPSDCPSLTVFIQIPEKTSLSAPIEACEKFNLSYKCTYSIPAKLSYPVSIPLLMNLSLQGDFLKENMTYNATTSILISPKTGNEHTVFKVTTKLILEPASIIWYIIVPCIFIGFALLAIIVRILHKCGFFSRKRLEILKREKENQLIDISDENAPSDAEDDNPGLDLDVD